MTEAGGRVKGAVATWSFDVFDTCLLRNRVVPSDVFYDIALRLQASLRPRLGPEFPTVFRDARVAAEQKARQSRRLEEVSLQDIWLELAALLPFLDVARGIESELEVERQAVKPNFRVLQFIDSLRQKTPSVIYISDTYLPAAFVRELLCQCGFLASSDRLYVSSEVGLTKASGNLFKHISSAERLKFKHWTHAGDSAHADVLMASRSGINSVHIRDSALTRFENRLIKETQFDNLLFASGLAARMRLFRLKAPCADMSTEYHYVASFLGPALFLFAHWVLSRAREQNLDRLYFFSRDCYALWKVADSLAPLFGNIECRYLKVSRQSLLLPGVKEISAQGMPWLFRPWEAPDIRKVLAKLELDLVSARELLADLIRKGPNEVELLDPQRMDEFWSRLQAEPLRSAIQGVIGERRADAIKYFRQEGLFDEVNYAVVDLGWFLTCQSALRSLLGVEQRGKELRGFYLGLDGSRVLPPVAGDASSMFYNPPYDRLSAAGRPVVFERVMALEHLLACAPHGSVQRYRVRSDGTVEAVTTPMAEDRQRANITLVDLAVEFAQGCDELLKGAWSVDHARLMDNLLSEAFSSPDGGWLKIAGSIPTSGDQNNIGAVPLCQSYKWREVLRRFVPATIRSRAMGVADNGCWPELSVVASAPTLRALIGMHAALTRMKRLMHLGDFQKRSYRTGVGWIRRSAPHPPAG